MQERLPSSRAAGDEPGREGQDEIDATKAPLLDHLIELRSRLIWALASFVLMFFLCFSVAGHIYNVLVWPYMWASGNDHVRLIATHFLEQIMTQVKLAMFGAAFLSFPIVATQIYKFVAPGLYKNERRAFLPYLIATPILFHRRDGCLFHRDAGLDPLLDRADADERRRRADDRASAEGFRVSVADHDADLRLRHRVPAARHINAVGAHRFCTSENLRHGRRYAIVAIFASAAILTPPDALSMVIMALPTIALYEASILAVRFVEKRQAGATS